MYACVCVCVCRGCGCVQSRGMGVYLSVCVNIQEGKLSSQKGMTVWGDNYEVQGAFSMLPQRVSSRIRFQFATVVSNLNMFLYIEFPFFPFSLSCLLNLASQIASPQNYLPPSIISRSAFKGAQINTRI